MTALVTVERSFGDRLLHFHQSEAGALYLTSEEIALALGYSDQRQVTRLFRRHIAELTPFKVGVKVTTEAGPREVTAFEERGVYLLACLARTKHGAAFRAWVAQTCQDIRRQDVVVVSREEWERHHDLGLRLLHAYEAQAAASAQMASLAGAVLATRRHTKPRTDPRQELIPGVSYELLTQDEAPAEEPAPDAEGGGA